MRDDLQFFTVKVAGGSGCGCPNKNSIVRKGIKLILT